MSNRRPGTKKIEDGGVNSNNVRCNSQRAVTTGDLLFVT